MSARTRQPPQCLPKDYPADMVERVRALYEAGCTQTEVARELGVTQKVIWRLMQRHGIAARPAVKRDQARQNNASWRGDAATYAALHKRVEVERGRPMKCERCGQEGPCDWANLSGNYADTSDYVRLCRPCHRRQDAASYPRDEAGRFVSPGR